MSKKTNKRAKGDKTKKEWRGKRKQEKNTNSIRCSRMICYQKTTKVEKAPSVMLKMMFHNDNGNDDVVGQKEVRNIHTSYIVL